METLSPINKLAKPFRQRYAAAQSASARAKQRAGQFCTPACACSWCVKLVIAVAWTIAMLLLGASLARTAGALKRPSRTSSDGRQQGDWQLPPIDGVPPATDGRGGRSVAEGDRSDSGGSDANLSPDELARMVRDKMLAGPDRTSAGGDGDGNVGRREGWPHMAEPDVQQGEDEEEAGEQGEQGDDQSVSPYRLREPSTQSYVWRPSGADTAEARALEGYPLLDMPVPTREDLEATAVVTMATGDESARHALALMQSVVDTGSRIPHKVLLMFKGGIGSTDCHNSSLRKLRGRDHIACDGYNVDMREIVSQIYLDAFARLGVEVLLLEPLPMTDYTKDIPGGRSMSWGMALNKLRVFGLTQFRRILWMDSDTFLIRNVDHLLLRPDFTAAFTTDCCNRNADAKMSGGLWVLTPSPQAQQRVQDMLYKPVPGTTADGWNFGDMQVVLYMFGKIEKERSERREWPFSRDLRQGMVPGIRILPPYANLSWDDLEFELTQNGRRGRLLPAGLQPAELEEAIAADKDVWHMLDPRYDGLVGNCECLAERDLKGTYFSVHFTCLPITPTVHKPGRYASEAEFMDHVRTRLLSCTRYYYLRWYDAFKRGMGGVVLEPVYEGPPVKVEDPAADAAVELLRKQAFDEAVAAEAERNRQAAAEEELRKQVAAAEEALVLERTRQAQQ